MKPVPSHVPICPKCQTPVGPEFCRPGELTVCPACSAKSWTEVFSALFRPLQKTAVSETVMIAGESTCFFHDSKRAVVVCDACGRFLCALCDWDVNGRHYCPPCFETGQKKGAVAELETVRILHSRQAFVLGVAPFLLTGIAAIIIALRHWKAPRSLVGGGRWQMPVALALGILQVVGYTVLFILLFKR